MCHILIKVIRDMGAETSGSPEHLKEEHCVKRVYDDLEEHSGGNSGGGQPKDKKVEMFTGQWRAEWCRSKNASEGVTFS